MPVIAERISLEELEQKAGQDSSPVFLQSALWGRHKASFGWKPLPVKWRRGEESGVLLILTRDLIPGISLAYVPHGPSSEAGREDRELFLMELSRELRGVLPLGCFFIRFDLPDYAVAEEEPEKLDKPFVKAPLDIQPPDTVVLDLKAASASEDPQGQLLGQMHKKTRYNIRLAEKKGVTVKVSGGEKLRDWYGLYETTAARDRIAIHPFSYYHRLFELVESGSDRDPMELKLLLAYSPDQELLAGIIVLFRGGESVYLYGASSNENRQLMPNYALQWEALKMALERGCTEYDLFGIPPTADPAHPMHGLYRMKTGFGGEIRHRPGAWDFPYSRLLYTAYKLLEAARRYYYKNWKKRR